MQVTVILHSIYREKLPPEARGRMHMSLPADATVASVFLQLQIPFTAVFSVNNQLEKNIHRTLKEGDEVRVFRQSTGGSGFPCQNDKFAL